MRRTVKIPLLTLAGLAGLAAGIALAALLVAQSQWFREQVRERIVREAENATGGRVEIGAFDLDWRRLTAGVKGFVIHGTEGPQEQPLFRADSVEAGLKILSVWKTKVDLASLVVVRPRVNLIVYADGRTNLPGPRAARQAGKGGLQRVLDLAIRRFRLVDGAVQVAARGSRIDALGEDLETQFVFEPDPARYRGQVSFRRLSIAPGDRPVIPFDVNAELVVSAQRLDIPRAYVGMRDSVVELRGALEDFASPRLALDYSARIQMKDIAPTMRVAQVPGVGRVLVDGRAAVIGSANYLVTGKLRGSGLAFEERGVHIRDIGLVANLEATPERIEFTGLEVSALGGRFHGRADLFPWSRFQVEGDVRDYALDELLRFDGIRRVAWNGTASGPVKLTAAIEEGKVRDIITRARLTIVPAAGENPVQGLIDLTYDQRSGAIDLAQSQFATRYSRTQLAGVLGRRIHVTVESTNLNDFEPAVAMFTAGPPPPMPVTLLGQGNARFQGSVDGPLKNPVIQGRATMTRFVWGGRSFDRAEADVVVSRAGVTARNATVVKDQMQAAGWVQAGFLDWRPEPSQAVSGAFSAKAAGVSALLSEFGRQLPATGGPVTAKVTLKGTIGSPEIEGDAQALQLVAWGQPLDSVRGHVRYTEGLLEIGGGLVQRGANRVDISGSYAYQPGDWREGRVRFHLASKGLDLAQVSAVAEWAPGVHGRLETELNGELALGGAGFRPGAINGTVAVRDLSAERDRLGSLTLTTSGQGKTLRVQLEGELAGARLNGESQWTLEGDYPFRGSLAFTPLRFSQLLAHLGRTAGREQSFEGLVAGKIEFSGLSVNAESWKAIVNLPALEIRPAPDTVAAARAGELVLRNSGPVVLELTRRGARVQQALFRGKDTELTVSGGVGFGARNPWDLRVRGGLNLSLMQDLDPRIVSSAGSVVLDVSVRGALARPDVYGRIDLKNVSLNLAGWPNGIDNANGLIFLYRDRATIDNLTAESGGGQVALSGFVGFDEATTFHLQARATNVRVRYPEGVSSTVSATLRFTGTVDRSLLSGDVTVRRVGFRPRSDLGSILAGSAQPVRTAANASRFEQGVHFDVHIVTSPQVRVETSLTRDIQADADLRLRGDLIRPVLLGRVLINQGEVMFFGNRYSINSGQILFVSASRIEPVVNMDLETKARGIDVTLHISGPIDKLNVSYRSDPPLSFPDIVALLATGSEPASLGGAAGGQTQVTQSWGQAGATALLSQAITNPIAGRLQRFFGVSQLKINPLVTGATTNNAAARVTLEQQVTQDLTFTYITDLSRAQAQTIRVEWILSKDWSAAAVREENGLFGIDFLYKKQFK